MFKHSTRQKVNFREGTKQDLRSHLLCMQSAAWGLFGLTPAKIFHAETSGKSQGGKNRGDLPVLHFVGQAGSTKASLFRSFMSFTNFRHVLLLQKALAGFYQILHYWLLKIQQGNNTINTVIEPQLQLRNNLRGFANQC